VISDPHHPDFRYPQPGERYWHRNWNRWCTIVEPWPSLLPSLAQDEVPVRIESGKLATVKLRSLDYLA
jgi:hypothetical protein